ncbi:MAG: hypothetical protein NVS9B15_19160 [Acidobacteriaceae bacterium]
MDVSPSDSNSPASYSKEFRLTKHADYDRVYKQGRRHFSQLMTFFYLERPTSPTPLVSHPRVGITVGRALGGAVQRNRIKRRIREAVRAHLHLVTGSYLPIDVVINPKKPVLTEPFERISAEVARAFAKLAANSPQAKTKSHQS